LGGGGRGFGIGKAIFVGGGVRVGLGVKFLGVGKNLKLEDGVLVCK
jgi:hypothetical protein